MNGVVYHVLKGQIEYDFELERFESLFSEHDLPMVRLETDYNAQDIEPLRLRVEAFAEIIRHRSTRDAKKEGIALEGAERPPQAETALWFSYGGGRELYYGTETDISVGSIQFYEMRMDGSVQSFPWGTPISAEAKGYFIAALPVRTNGTGETVYDFARADLGPHAYAAVPRGFHIEEVPFELAYEERKKIQVFFDGEPLSDSQVLVTTADFEGQPRSTDKNGYIENLPVRYI